MADKNLIFDIYNEDGTSFNGLSLKKSTFSTVMMSLNDRIEGDVYYKDNDLSFTFKEYILYTGIKYSLKVDAPPTIVKKGMKDDNNELKGMTKYSFTFYHPMVLLYNIPFTDISVSDSDSKYKSQDTTFYWVGTLTEMVAKLNKNLQGTPFTCALQSGFVDNGIRSDVIQFQDQKITDVLKTTYDTWGVPFVVDGYNILFGKPSNEIYIEGTTTPFVFKLGQNLGFKNGDRTPKNNTVVTRIAGYGSTDNIPNGYPIIQWTGDQSWKYTVNDNSTSINSYPIIDGVINGASVKIINHPFTRKTLMPSIYADCVNKKVNPFAVGYDKDIELIDYYDAIDDVSHTYTNHINTLSPSYYKKGFDGSDKTVSDIKPTIVGAKYNNQEIDIIKSISWINDDQTAASGIDDTYNTKTEKYVQGYFKIEFYPLGFDLYAMAAATSAMSVNMTGGACNGCKFELAVDWDVVKTNFYYIDKDGNAIFDPTNIYSAHRDYDKFPNSENKSISVIVKKDTNTFGILMPNVYQQPKANDTFVFIGISMPNTYITSAQTLLDEAMKVYMEENNVAYFEYPVEFDNYFLETNTYILNQINTNSIIRFDYATDTFALSVKEFSITWGDKALPTYNITLTDDISVVTNPVGTVAEGLSKLGSQVAQMQASYNINIIDELNKKLSRKEDDKALGHITFNDGIDVNNGISSDSLSIDDFISGISGGFFGVDSNGKIYLEVDKILVRIKAYFESLEIKKTNYIAGEEIISPAGGIVCIKTEEFADVYRCHFCADDGDIKVNNYFAIDDLAICKDFNIKSGVYENVSNNYYWRRIMTIGDDYIDLSKTDCDANSEIPAKGDKICHLGNKTNTDRQAAIILSATNNYAPCITLYAGINSYSLANKEYIQYGYDKNTGKAFHTVYGDSYVGARDGSEYLKYTEEDGVKVKGKLEQGTSLADGTDINNLRNGKINLLQNSGFTGDYQSSELNADTPLSEDTPLFSNNLKNWDNSNAVVSSDNASKSAFSCSVVEGFISQPLYYSQINNEHYILSFKAKGSSITAEIGGQIFSQTLATGYTQYSFKFISGTGSILRLSGTYVICEIELTIGNIVNDWQASPLDNNKELARFQSLKYLTDAIANGSSSWIGGLILSSIIMLGNYKDEEMNKVTAGISGTYNNDDDVYTWGGGTFEQAIRTVQMFKDNPSYQPTDEELKTIAKAVITHGGRAIFNDGIFRGGVYADFGIFKGLVKGGRLDAVTGTFKSLICVDNDGNEIGEMTFDSGKIVFNSCDIQNQGEKDNRPLRFLTANLWCRNSFGSQYINYAVVSGDTIYYYVNGNNTDYVSAVMSSQTYNGNTYYKIPLYPLPTFSGLTSITKNGDCNINDIYGFPVNMIVFNISSGNWYYNLIATTGKEVTIINTNDNFNDIRYASCQSVGQQLNGGSAHTLTNLSDWMSPARTDGSIDKSGWMIKGTYDNSFN